MAGGVGEAQIGGLSTRKLSLQAQHVRNFTRELKVKPKVENAPRENSTSSQHAKQATLGARFEAEI